MTTSFYLTRPDADSETAIFARICYSRCKVKFYLPEKIHPKYWSETKVNWPKGTKGTTKRAPKIYRVVKSCKQSPEFNQRLNDIESAIKNTFRKYVNDHNGTPPLPDELKKSLNKEIKELEPVQDSNNTFFGLFENIISETKKGLRINPRSKKPITKATLKGYVTTYKHLKAFEKTTKTPIDFNSIDLDFYKDFLEFLMRGKVRNKKTKKLETLNLASNTIGKHIQVIKMVLNDATERGINTNLAYKRRHFIAIREESDNIYLTPSEIKEIENLDLSDNNELDLVRDLFLIGCSTGLRWSNYSTIKPENIVDDFLEVVQIKTGNPVSIPIEPMVKRILEKYGNHLPPSPNNQKSNEYLREIGSRTKSLNTQLSKKITKGGVSVIKTVKKYELLTTHTARRSMATNEYKAGMPVTSLMQITGHKTEKMFLMYLKLNPQDHALILKTHREKRNNLVAV